MKIVTTANWILIGLYGILLIYTLLNLNRSGNDAAGRGMEQGFILLGAILLAGLVLLNPRPWRSAKITALVLAGLPFLMILHNLVSNFWVSYKQQKRDDEQSISPGNTRDSDR